LPPAFVAIALRPLSAAVPTAQSQRRGRDAWQAHCRATAGSWGNSGDGLAPGSREQEGESFEPPRQCRSCLLLVFVRGCALEESEYDLRKRLVILSADSPFNGNIRNRTGLW